MKIFYFFNFYFLQYFLGHAAWHVASQFPNQGSKPCPLHGELRVLITGLPGKSQTSFNRSLFISFSYIIFWLITYTIFNILLNPTEYISSSDFVITQQQHKVNHFLNLCFSVFSAGYIIYVAYETLFRRLRAM